MADHSRTTLSSPRSADWRAQQRVLWRSRMCANCWRARPGGLGLAARDAHKVVPRRQRGLRHLLQAGEVGLRLRTVVATSAWRARSRRSIHHGRARLATPTTPAATTPAAPGTSAPSSNAPANPGAASAARGRSRVNPSRREPGAWGQFEVFHLCRTRLWRCGDSCSVRLRFTGGSARRWNPSGDCR